jgi:hypothetical protein
MPDEVRHAFHHLIDIDWAGIDGFAADKAEQPRRQRRCPFARAERRGNVCAAAPRFRARLNSAMLPETIVRIVEIVAMPAVRGRRLVF